MVCESNSLTDSTTSRGSGIRDGYPTGAMLVGSFVCRRQAVSLTRVAVSRLGPGSGR